MGNICHDSGTQFGKYGMKRPSVSRAQLPFHEHFRSQLVSSADKVVQTRRNTNNGEVSKLADENSPKMLSSSFGEVNLWAKFASGALPYRNFIPKTPHDASPRDRALLEAPWLLMGKL